LRWNDLRHEGACRLLTDGVDIRIIQLMLGHASIQQTQRYLNVTDEELDVTTALRSSGGQTSASAEVTLDAIDARLELAIACLFATCVDF